LPHTDVKPIASTRKERSPPSLIVDAKDKVPEVRPDRGKVTITGVHVLFQTVVWKTWTPAKLTVSGEVAVAAPL